MKKFSVEKMAAVIIERRKAMKITKELDLSATLDGEEAYSNADFVVIAAPTNYDSKKNFFGNPGHSRQSVSFQDYRIL